MFQVARTHLPLLDFQLTDEVDVIIPLVAFWERSYNRAEPERALGIDLGFATYCGIVTLNELLFVLALPMVVILRDAFFFAMYLCR